MSLPPVAKPRLALVIESHAGVRRLIGRMLEHLGIDAMYAADGDQAVAHCASFGYRFDLLIAGVGGTGSPRTFVISSILARWPALAIILLTDNPRGDHSEYVGPLRAAILGKPFSAAQLAEAIECALAASESRKLA